MDLIIESFKRLYKDNQIDDTTLSTLVTQGIITKNDEKYIKEVGE